MKCLAPALKRCTSGDQAGKPVLISLSEHFCSSLVVKAICTDRAEHHVVFEYNRAIEGANVKSQFAATGGHASKTDDTIGAGSSNDIEDNRRCTGALDHNVGAKVFKHVHVIDRAKRVNELRLWSDTYSIEYMHLEAQLHSEQRSQQTDRSGPGHEGNMWLPCETA